MSQVMRAFCLLLSFALGFCQSSAITSTPRSFLSDTTTMPCPSGYYNGGDGSCYSSLYSQNYRNYAYNLCTSNGGYLYSISSATENNKTSARAGSLSTVWLGMTCTSNLTTSCAWDISPTKTLSTFDYSNFAAGHPNPKNLSQGPCVYMDVKTGLWFSADCSSFRSYYGCRWTSGVAAPFCSRSVYMGSYYDTYAFRNKCYWSTTRTSYLGAKSVCASNCGTVASIHSSGENSFIQGLSSTAYTYAYTGLTLNTTGQYVWDDDSTFNFNNFGYQNQQLGNCVSMALRPGLVQSGEWINSDCEQTIPTICEKNQINTCDTTTTTPKPTTRPPVFCPTPQFFSGNGIIYSPGYPYGMDSSSCEYLITVDQNRTAQIYFSSIYLHSYSKLIFYSDIYSKTPFRTLSSNWNSPTTVISSTNVIRMYFNSSYNDGSYWVANYGAVSLTTTTTRPSSQKCTYATSYSNNGTIYSPGYPQTCNTENTCIYKITEGSSYKALISFSDIYLPYSSTISFYSSDTASTPFKTLTGQYYTTAVVSPTNFIKMNYTTNYGDGSYWVANYASAPSCDTSKYYSGTITSDGYPNYYSTPNYGRNCTYTLNSMQSQTCIVFDNIYLRSGDYIRVYDGAVGLYLIASYGSSDYGTSYPYCTTRSSEMNVVFQVQPNNGYVAQGFSARFAGSTSSLSNSSVTTTTMSSNNPVYYYYDSGPVTSDNYPFSYPDKTQNTTYVMNANQAKTCLVFDTCDLRTYDYITLYDGNSDTNWSATQIIQIGANDGKPTYTYCSYYNTEISLVFSTYQYSFGGSGQGFKVRFTGSAGKLKTNSTSISFHFFVAFFTFVWSFLR